MNITSYDDDDDDDDDDADVCVCVCVCLNIMCDKGEYTASISYFQSKLSTIHAIYI